MKVRGRYQWNLVSEKGFSMEQFWDWANVDSINKSGDLFNVLEHCAYFEK